jgi:Protein of unknown function (DUF3667)
MPDELRKLVMADTAADALERRSRKRRFFGRKKPQRPPPIHCENCGAQLHGHWCAKCGQPAIDYHRSFGVVLVDVLDEFLNWDSKFFGTIALLIAKPWKLTNDFIAGHRVRYVHPLRLYLLASILFFFAINFFAKKIHFDANALHQKDRAEIAAELKKNKDIPPEARAKIEEALKLHTPVPPSPAPPKEKSSPASNENLSTEAPAFFQSGNPKTPFEKWLEARAKAKLGEHGTSAALFMRTVISNLPYMMLCCIPLFAFVLKVLYFWRKVFYIDHLIYALHIHTFAYIGIILIGGITIGFQSLGWNALFGWIVGLLWTGFAVQVFLSIQRVYRQGWFFTIFKFLLGGFFYLLVLSLALAATFFVTLALPD